MGRIGASHGLRGWLRVHPYTRDPADALAYGHWLVACEKGWREFELVDGRVQGSLLLCRLAGVDSRDAADDLRGAEIAVRPAQLAALPEGEYYWHQLEGLTVENLDGAVLGRVAGLMETGANDVLIVSGDRERLVPYTDATVRMVDLDAGVIRVDWEPDF
jgi:16S rRNA processing protein RimM